MGNRSSCINRRAGLPTANLVDPDGHLHPIDLPMSAAELMIEHPSHVVSRAQDLLTTRRVEAMRAGEQLRPNEVYLLLRMNWVGSRIHNQQVEVIKGIVHLSGRGSTSTSTSNAMKMKMKVMKKRMVDSGLVGGSKVVPDTEGEKDTGCSGENEVSGDGMGGLRQWRPVLEPIIEC